ncbi:hypothetical protein HDU98_010536 [Podochytrium sp. JEL0797]|nr:hypothetical protein HDU98_010536 [Podochytrium sp. JEL0797]
MIRRTTKVITAPDPADPQKWIKTTTVTTTTVTAKSLKSQDHAITPTARLPPAVKLQRIEDPTQQDIDCMIRLRTDCGWGAVSVPAWIDDPERLNFFVRASGEVKEPVIGMISLILEYPDSDFAHRATHKAMIASLCILKAWEGRGYGKQSVRELEAYAAREFGAKEITLETAGESLLRMYSSLGYTEFRERRATFYSDSVASFRKAIAVE